MQVDLDAAKKTAVAAGESLHAARGDSCRTRLLELSAADMGLLDGAGRTSDEEGSSSMDATVRERRDRLLAKAKCIDGQLALMPRCVRAGPSTHRCTVQVQNFTFRNRFRNRFGDSRRDDPCDIASSLPLSVIVCSLVRPRAAL